MASHALPQPAGNRLVLIAKNAIGYLNPVYMVAVLVLLHAWLTAYVYTDIIGGNLAFRLAGFEYYPPLPFTPLVAAAVCVIPLTWLRCSYRQLSDILVLQVYFFVFVPTAVYITIGVPASLDRQLQLHALMIGALALLELRRLLPPIEIFRVPTQHSIYVAGLVSLAIAALAYMTFFGELSLDNLDLSTVYERRADTIEAQGGTLISYVANWSSFALAPICILYGWLRSNWLLVGLGLVIALESFAVTSFRSNLFLPLFAVGVTLLLRLGGPKSIGAGMALVALALSIVPAAVDFILGQDGLYSWMIHFRFIGNNGFLSAQYFSFFEFAQRGGYQDSFGRFFADPVYNRPIAELVGSSFSIEGNHANGNLWADGYGNFGVVGVGIASLSLAIVAWLIDSIAEGKQVLVGVVTAVVIGFGAGNTAVHSVLTSNGGLLLLILLILLPARDQPSPSQGI